MTAVVNEPAANAGACLKMVQGYARFLLPGDPLLKAPSCRSEEPSPA